MNPILEVFSLKKYFPVRGGASFGERDQVRAVDDVNFMVDRGETLSIVGESGCGKSTLARTILRLTPATSGQVWLDGWRIDNMPSPQVQKLRSRLQVVFQDPFSSLSPRMRVRDIIAEPLVNFHLAKGRSEVDDRVAGLLETVGLARDDMRRFPHEFSGGQRQRIGIARALASNPELIICDEAVSALDVSIKAQIVNLLADLKAELKVAYLFISHDLAVVEHLTDRVAVMYLGVIVEIADRGPLFSSPAHPYTRALLSSIPTNDPERRGRPILIRGEPPSPINPPSGCRFRTRCPFAWDRCTVEVPLLRERAPGQMAACHLDALPEVEGSAAA